MKPEFDFDAEEVEYLRHGPNPLLATIYRPRGPGPFPSVIEVHGGAWCRYDRSRGRTLHHVLAGAGFVVVAIDFRQGGTDRYPSSLQDINYAIRWVKVNAQQLGTRPDQVALSGQSSGGHLALLAGMRPYDERYDAISLPTGSPSVDATVRCLNLVWPLVNPLGRYRHLKALIAGNRKPDWSRAIVDCHDAFWPNEASMEEGSPLLMLARKEKVHLPPAICIQPRHDDAHVYHDPGVSEPGTDTEKFLRAYADAGGDIRMEYFDVQDHFTQDHPELPESQDAFRRMVAFLSEKLS